MNTKDLLKKVIDGDFLNSSESEFLMDQITRGEISSEQTSALVSIMRHRGETASEVSGFVKSLMKQATAPGFDQIDAIDMVGTGGDGLNTFNITTTASMVCAALGVNVAKHGNRAVTSKSGSSDVLKALGYPIELSPTLLKKGLDQFNFGFFYAPLYHQAFKFVAPIRKALGIRTVFNFLGPLVNPMNVKKQLIGVYSPSLIPLMVETLKELGKTHAIVVSSDEGMDEFSLSSDSQYAVLKDGKIEYKKFSPSDIGLNKTSIEELAGGNANFNAEIIRNILAGKDQGPRADIVALNAGAGLLLAGKVESIEAGYTMAKKALIDGKCKGILIEFANFTQELLHVVA
jgi:anthranilate phosphoribosyltransferase